MILSASETIGRTILEQVIRCAHIGFRERNERPIKIAVSPGAWDSILNFYERRPMRLQEAKDGQTARIILFVEGKRVEICASRFITDFNHQEWVLE